MSKLFSVAILPALLLFPALSRAQDTAVVVAPAVPFRPYTVTISPLLLLLPLVEVTGEYRLLPSWSVVAMGGGGQVSEDNDDGSGTTTDLTVWEVGGQVRYYPFARSKHELNVGGEILWLHLAGGAIDNTGVSGEGAGTAVGPFVGYKYTASFGLTFDAQFGYQFIVAHASTDDGGGASGSEGAPLLNLNLGWSF